MNSELESLRISLSLPDPTKVRESLKDLKFYALCPDGKRIPVEDMCDENDNNLVLRTFEDRLVLVIQAVRGSGASNERVYWNQAFYLSTGTSSGMPGTWLPFDGILLRETYQNQSAPSAMSMPLSTGLSSMGIGSMGIGSMGMGSMGIGSMGMGMGSMGLGMGSMGLGMGMPIKKPSLGLAALAGTRKGGGYVRSWFSKQSFAGPDKNRNKSNNTTNLSTLTPEQKQNVLLVSVYGSGLYLPEGDYLFGSYAFRRFGTLSFALASHAIGGKLFKGNSGGDTLYLPRNQKEMNAIDSHYKDIFNTPSPLQPCFTKMQTEYPITKAYLVNKYIEDNKAFSYMNMFREEGIFPLGLSAFSVPIKNLTPAENKLPFEKDVDHYLGKLHTVWREYKLGKRTIETVKTALATQPSLNLTQTHELTRKQKEQINYYRGGTRRRKTKKRKSTQRLSR